MNYINDNRLRAEFFGTLVLVLVGCSSIVLTGLGGAFPLAALPIGLAFGLAFAAMVYTIGPVSGCHINPAVTAALWSAGRISGADAIRYVIAQLIGAFVAALLLVIIVKGKAGGYHVADSGLGATTWGTFGVWPAMIVEFIGTTIFTLVEGSWCARWFDHWNNAGDPASGVLQRLRRLGEPGAQLRTGAVRRRQGLWPTLDVFDRADTRRLVRGLADQVQDTGCVTTPFVRAQASLYN
jgi:hypothetical protein